MDKELPEATKKKAIKKWEKIISLTRNDELKEAIHLIDEPCAFCEEAMETPGCTECRIYKVFGIHCVYLEEWEQHSHCVYNAEYRGNSTAMREALISMSNWAIETIKAL